MSDEQLEQGIAAIQEMLAKRESSMVDLTPKSWRPGNIGDSRTSRRAQAWSRSQGFPSASRRTGRERIARALVRWSGFIKGGQEGPRG